MAAPSVLIHLKQALATQGGARLSVVMGYFLAALVGPGLLAAQAAPQTAVFTPYCYEGTQPVGAAVMVGRVEFVNLIIAGLRSNPTITRVGADSYERARPGAVYAHA